MLIKLNILSLLVDIQKMKLIKNKNIREMIEYTWSNYAGACFNMLFGMTFIKLKLYLGKILQQKLPIRYLEYTTCMYT